MLNKGLKAKWLKALRSGRYKQGIGKLRTDTDAGPQYCCLGVLAQISGAKWRAGVPFIKGKQVSSSARAADLEIGFLSPRFCGLRMSTQRRLADKNDGNWRRGWRATLASFNEIADYIEKRL